jgi:DNA-binding NarL/FixJ family response regulator
MASPNAPAALNDGSGLRTLIVSEIRFLRESLREILGRAPGLRVCGDGATLAHAVELATDLQPDIVLLDVAFPGGPDSATRLAKAAPRGSIVALAMIETEENVLAWAVAGVAGYVPSTASIGDLIDLIGQISRGEQSCPSRIVGRLLRSVGPSAARPPAQSTPLTQREHEVYRLIGAGLSNKDIARRLGISLGTTKSHVHNLLGKMRIQRRSQVIIQARTPG